MTLSVHPNMCSSVSELEGEEAHHRPRAPGPRVCCGGGGWAATVSSNFPVPPSSLPGDCAQPWL